MRISLYGIGGTYNFGCDAIVRGTEKIIHSGFPDAEIDYYTYSYSEDKKRLSDCNVNVISMYKNNIFRVFLKAVTKLELVIGNNSNPFRLSNRIRFSWIKKYDIVISIGGDIYTLPPKAQCTAGSRYTNPLLEFGEFCKRQNVKLIVWGASIGPFDAEPDIKNVFMKHLDRCVTHIVAREKHTAKYLADNGINHFSLHGDPAFAVDRKVPSVAFENRIGINLSPLSIQYLESGIDIEDYINCQVQTIVALARSTKMGITLVPHVFSNTSTDDDYSYLKRIESELKDLDVDVELKKCSNFLEAKEVLAKCRLVIAARMHCAINAITCGVPTVFLSYSEKSRGMCEMVYGTEDFAIPIRDFERVDDMVSLVNRMIFEEEFIRKQILNQVAVLKASSLEAYSCLK